MQEFWLAVSEALGRMFGSAFALVIQVLIYLLVVYVCWGLIWDRIITKAGYKGKAFRWRFLMMVLPVFISPIALYLPYQASQAFGTVMVLTFYLGLFILALHPWPSIQKSKSTTEQKP